jgi:hypothetical protein
MKSCWKCPFCGKVEEADAWNLSHVHEGKEIPCKLVSRKYMNKNKDKVSEKQNTPLGALEAAG